MRLNTIIAPSTSLAAKITTRELADMLRIVPQTVRASVCRNGHYLGVKVKSGVRDAFSID